MYDAAHAKEEARNEVTDELMNDPVGMYDVKWRRTPKDGVAAIVEIVGCGMLLWIHFSERGIVRGGHIHNDAAMVRQVRDTVLFANLAVNVVNLVRVFPEKDANINKNRFWVELLQVNDVALRHSSQ